MLCLNLNFRWHYLRLGMTPQTHLNSVVFRLEIVSLFSTSTEAFLHKWPLNGWLSVQPPVRASVEPLQSYIALVPFHLRGSPENLSGLRCFTAQLADKTLHNQIPSATSAANLAVAFLQSVLFNIQGLGSAGTGVDGDGGEGGVMVVGQFLRSFGPRSRHGEKWGVNKEWTGAGAG